MRSTKVFVLPATLWLTATFAFAGEAPTGACCRESSCSQEPKSDCGFFFAFYYGDGTNCEDVTCPPPGAGACCLPAGSQVPCVIAVEAACEETGANFAGAGTTCAEDCQVVCCFTDGTCTDGLGGKDCFFADGVDVVDVGCDACRIGACCREDGSCVLAPMYACAGQAGGAGTSCLDVTCCAGDIDGDGQVRFDDLLLLLGAWGDDGPGAGIAAPHDVVSFADLVGLLSHWGPCD